MKHPRLLAHLLCLLALLPGAVCAQGPSQAGSTPDQRPGDLDMVLLIDKSLSMAPFYPEVKAYAAQKVLEPALVPGDRLIIETVYGRVDRLLSMSIGTEEDKAKAIRAVGAIKADGRFTDLGKALDVAKKDLDELGQPDRPKYVLLITDERQEAPHDSPYQAPDYKLKHPSLEYIKRLDLGKFRAITVGIQVGARVEKAAPDVMKFLEEPPSRGGAVGGGLGTTETAGPKAGPVAAAAAGASSSVRALPSWLFGAAAILLLLALAGLAGVLLLSKRRKKEKETN